MGLRCTGDGITAKGPVPCYEKPIAIVDARLDGSAVCRVIVLVVALWVDDFCWDRRSLLGK